MTLGWLIAKRRWLRQNPAPQPALRSLISELEEELRREDMTDYDNAPRPDRDYAKEYGKLPPLTEPSSRV